MWLSQRQLGGAQPTTTHTKTTPKQQDLDDFLKGKVVSRVDPSDDTKVLEGAAPSEFEAKLLNRRVLGAGRKGKQCWLSFEGGVHLLIHLGMDGELLIRGDGGRMLRGYKYRAQLKGAHAAAFPPSHCKILVAFSDGTELAFDEWRRFGRARLVEGDVLACDAVAKLGWDAHDELPAPRDFEAGLRARGRSKLKAVLLDQGFCAGIGNWVADEVLYMVRSAGAGWLPLGFQSFCRSGGCVCVGLRSLAMCWRGRVAPTLSLTFLHSHSHSRTLVKTASQQKNNNNRPASTRSSPSPTWARSTSRPCTLPSPASSATPSASAPTRPGSPPAGCSTRGGRASRRGRSTGGASSF